SAHINDSLFCAPPVERTFGHQPGDSIGLLNDLFTEVGDFFGKFDGPSWGLAVPKRDGRSGAARIFDTNASGFDAANAPRRRAEQEYVSCKALDRKVLINSADNRLLWFGDDVVVCILRNRPA